MRVREFVEGLLERRYEVRRRPEELVEGQRQVGQPVRGVLKGKYVQKEESRHMEVSDGKVNERRHQTNQSMPLLTASCVTHLSRKRVH